MQVMYSVAVRTDGDAESTFDALQQQVASWAVGSEPAPSGFFSGRGTAVVNEREIQWESITVEDSPHQLWKLEICSPLGEGGEAEFVCAVSVAKADTSTGMRVELGRRSKVARLAPVQIDFIDRPRLIPLVLNSVPCYYGDEQVRAQPIRARASDVPEVVQTLTQSSRRLPVIIFSSTADGSQEDRLASAMANRLAGLAHVFLLETWLALDSLNAKISTRVPLRGARLFWPTAAGTTRNPWWTSRLLEDERAVSDRLFNMLSRLSVAANPRDQLAEAVRAAERRSAQEKAERRIRAAEKSGDVHRLVNELRAQIVQEREMSEFLIEANEELEQENRELRTYKDNFEAISRHYESSSQEDEPTLEELQVSPDFRELWSALEVESDGALIFTESAKESWIQSGYPYRERMRRTLETLARAAVGWRATTGRLGKSMVTWMSEEYGLTYAPDDEGIRRRKLDTFTFDGSKFSRLPHIKIDDRVSPDRVGRVYFAIDDDSQRWIVDHVGIKLGI